MRALALGAVLLLATGCSAVSADIVKSLADSDRSWCISVTTIYGTVRMGGSGAEHAAVLCSAEGFKLDNSAAGGGASIPVELAPVRLRMVPQ